MQEIGDFMENYRPQTTLRVRKKQVKTPLKYRLGRIKMSQIASVSIKMSYFFYFFSCICEKKAVILRR